jgi:DNA polymerase
LIIMIKGIEPSKLKALADWYTLSGVDAATSDEPADWFKASAAAPTQAVRPQSVADTRRPAPSAPAPRAKQAQANGTLAASSPAKALSDARTLAPSAQSIDELKAALTTFDGCALKKMAKNLCFADGNAQASLMFIGEAPGRDEDLSGTPFVGRAGQLLDRMLEAIELKRAEDVWITNTVFWRPPGNRTPSLEETEICRPFLDRQIELLQPKIIVPLGGAAAKQLLQTTSGIMRLRGKWQEIEIAGAHYPILPTLHPAYLLRNPAGKKLAWRDLLEIKTRLQAK